jgi:dTDP-4-dehydrorhamnose reductase
LNLSHDTPVLITGVSGALGWALARRIRPECSLIGTYFSHECVPDGVAPAYMNLASAGSVDDVIKTHRPAVVVHAAAMTDPDACERAPEKARAVTFEGSARLAAQAARLGAKVIFISTDLVFDGARGNYEETDEARPLSVYGRAKLDAECAVLGVPGSVVIRSSLIYGRGSPASGTFFSGLYATLCAGGRMRLFTDQMRNPVLEDDLAGAVVLAIEQDLEGLYHVGGPEAISRLDFGRTACEVFGLDAHLLEPIRMSEFEYVADRPLDSTLNISRFASLTGFEPLGIRGGLMHLRSSLPD